MAFKQANELGLGDLLIENLTKYNIGKHDISELNQDNNFFNHLPKLHQEKINKMGDEYKKMYIQMLHIMPEIFISNALRNTDILIDDNLAKLELAKDIKSIERRKQLGDKIYNEFFDHNKAKIGIENECTHIRFKFTPNEFQALNECTEINTTYGISLFSSENKIDNIPIFNVILEKEQEEMVDGIPSIFAHIEIVTAPICECSLNKNDIIQEDIIKLIEDFNNIVNPKSKSLNMKEIVHQLMETNPKLKNFSWNYDFDWIIQDKIEDYKKLIKEEKQQFNDYLRKIGPNKEINEEDIAVMDKTDNFIKVVEKEIETLENIRLKKFDIESLIQCNPQLNIDFTLDSFFTNPSVFKSMLNFNPEGNELGSIFSMDEVGFYDIAREITNKLYFKIIQENDYKIKDKRNYALGMTTLAIYQSLLYAQLKFFDKDKILNKNDFSALLKTPIADLPRLPGIKEEENELFLTMLKSFKQSASEFDFKSELGQKIKESSKNSSNKDIDPTSLVLKSFDYIDEWYLRPTKLESRYSKETKDKEGVVEKFVPLEKETLEKTRKSPDYKYLETVTGNPVWIPLKKDGEVRILFEKRGNGGFIDAGTKLQRLMIK